MSTSNKPFLIGICGGSGSGKTSVANIIFKYIGWHNCLLYSMDSYYKGPNDEERKKLSEYNFDHPDAIDLDLLSKHLAMLMNNEPIEMPIYEFNGSYRKKETVRIVPNKWIIFEGILTFHDKRMRDWMDMKIFVDLDSDIRLSRRVYRDIKDRGRGIDTIIERYHKFVKPAFEGFIKPTRKFADVIIPRGAENTQAIDLISQHLKFGLVQRICGQKDEIFTDSSITQINLRTPWNKDTIFKPFDKVENVVITVESEKTKTILLKILNDWFNNHKPSFYKMYRKIMIESLLKQYNGMKSGVFYTTYLNLKNVPDKLNEISMNKNIAIFIPDLTTLSAEYISFFETIIKKKQPDAELTVLSITWTNSSLVAISALDHSIKLITLYNGDGLPHNKECLKNGNTFLGTSSNGDWKDAQPFTINNFERRFLYVVNTLQ